MENTRKFETYNREIQKFIIDMGMYEYKRRGLANLSDDEVIMKINSINKSDSDDFYQDKIKLLEETINKYKKEQELTYERHQNELKERKAKVRAYVDDVLAYQDDENAPLPTNQDKQQLIQGLREHMGPGFRDSEIPADL